MSELSDKIAYIKGLCEGLDIKADTPERKLLLSVIDALDAVAGELKSLRDDHEELKEYVDVIDDDVSELEDEVYGDEDDDLDLEDYDEDEDDDDDDDDEQDAEFSVAEDDDEDSDGCGEDGCDCEECHCGHEHGISDAMLDQPLAERPCPSCGKSIGITLRALLNKDEPIVCPHCGGKFRAADSDDK